MQKPVLAALAGAVLLSGCAYHPEATELVRIWDSPADMNACRRLGAVSERVPTGRGFEHRLQDMRQAVLEKGGADLYLRRTTPDYAFVVGEAYRCAPGYSGFEIGDDRLPQLSEPYRDVVRARRAARSTTVVRAKN